ncbi:PLP-dependent transferase [Daedaleopsis nitida]|nr:PLP-dependent transferase [Daedaleopsis nitida]
MAIPTSATLYDEIASVLGTPVPATDHALSVSMPTWSDNVGYMKGDKAILDALLSGYPRFVLPLNVRKASRAFGFALASLPLMSLLKRLQLERICEERFGAKGERCLLFPSSKIAEQCRAFLVDHSSRAGLSISVHLVHFSVCAEIQNPKTAGGELHIVLFPETASRLAKQFWQHTGTGISSRRAAHCEQLLGGDPSGRTPHDVAPGTPPVSNGRHHLSTTGAGTSRTMPDDSAQPIFGGNQAELLGKTECDYVAETCRSTTRPLECAADAKRAIRRRIAGFLSLSREEATSSRSVAAGGLPVQSEHGMQAVMTVAEDDMWLFPTGMSAIWHAHHLCMGLRPGAKSLKLEASFPYVDTYKCLEKWGPGVHFFGGGADEEIDDLERLLERESQSLGTCSISALFTEFPFNPRLRSPNLPRLRELADKYAFAIVVDDTIGNFINVQVLQYADIVVSSLSKIFSGEANVMGGSLAFNPMGRWYPEMKAHLIATFEDTWFDEDAIQMELNSRNLCERISAIDANALAVCEFLRSRSLSACPSSAAPRTVFYPKWMTRDNYDACRARGPRGDPTGGYGGLLSLTFVSLEAARAYYDALPCAKGPSLGTNFTLSCPYTIIAHYQELEWAASWGVEEGLVRISVGMEERNTVLRWVEKGLLAAEAVVR